MAQTEERQSSTLGSLAPWLACDTELSRSRVETRAAAPGGGGTDRSRLHHGTAMDAEADLQRRR